MPLARLAHVIGAVRRQARAGVVPGKVGNMRPHILPRDDRQRLVETLAQPLDPLRRRIEPREMRQQQPRIMAPPHAHQLAAKPHGLLHPIESARRQHLLDMRPRQHQRPLPPLRKSRVAPPQQIRRSPAHPHAGTSRPHVALLGKVMEKPHLAIRVPSRVGDMRVVLGGVGGRRGREDTRAIALALPGLFRCARSQASARLLARNADIASPGNPPPPEPGAARCLTPRGRGTISAHPELVGGTIVKGHRRCPRPIVHTEVIRKVRHRPPRTRGKPRKPKAWLGRVAWGTGYLSDVGRCRKVILIQNSNISG